MLKVGFIVFLYFMQICVGLPASQSVRAKAKTAASPKDVLANLQRLIEGLIRLLEKVSETKKLVLEELFLKLLSSQDILGDGISVAVDAKKSLIETTAALGPHLIDSVSNLAKNVSASSVPDLRPFACEVLCPPNATLTPSQTDTCKVNNCTTNPSPIPARTKTELFGNQYEDYEYPT